MKGSGRGASGGEEAAWRDLIANYEAEPEADGGPTAVAGAGEPARLAAGRDAAGRWPGHRSLADPRPERRHGPGAGPRPRPGGSPGPGPADGPVPRPAPGHRDVPGADGPPASTATGPAVNGPAAHGPGPTGRNEDPAPAGPAPERPAADRPPGQSACRPAPADDGEFVPPVPPPLPSLDPVAKGAWAALFGGPGYLLLATMVGWAIPGWAAFLAVAAFVGGFATLVIRMGDKDSARTRSVRGPDDGAVV